MPSLLRPLAIGLLLALATRTLGSEGAAPGEGSGGRSCLGEGRAKLLLGEGLYGQTNPLGLENQLQLGLCAPLIRTPGLLYDYTNVQVGLVADVSPVYAMPGAFLSIAPLSLLELRWEVEAVREWPIGRDGSGYFPLASADASFRHLPADQARSAHGLSAAFTGTLQAELEVAPRWALVAVDSAAYAWWQLGSAPFYYNARYDLVMARRDWVGKNLALLLLGREVSERIKVRAGAIDDLTWVASSGYRANVLGGLVAAVLSRWPGERSETQPFVRVGVYTDHAFRKGQLQLLAGAAMTFDVTPGRTARTP
jgi:hypothetical protein